MKRYMLIPAAFAVIVGLSGCDALLNQQNLFSSLEPNLTTKLNTNMSNDSLLSTLKDCTASSSFYDDLAANPTLAESIETQLDTIIDNPSSSPATVEEAALYLSGIVLNTTEVGDVVNSLVESMTSNTSSSTTTSIVDSVLAPVNNLIVSGDEAAFTEFVNNVLLLGDTYNALATAVTTTGSTVSADVAQAAAVVLIMDTVISAIDANGDGNASNDTPSAKIAALYDTLTALQTNSSTTLPLDSSFNFTTALFGTSATNDSSIERLLGAAGLTNMTSLISQMIN